MNSALSLKMHPELAVAMMHTRNDKGYVLWLLVRALDFDGRGFIPRKTFIAELLRRGLYNKKTLEQQMKHDGLGTFWVESTWRLDGKSIRLLHYKSLLRITEKFSCQQLSAPSRIPEHQIGQCLQQRRSTLYAVASAAPLGCWKNPRSRAYLEDCLRREKTTQRRYETAAGVSVVPNFCKEYTHPTKPAIGQLPNSRFHLFKQCKRGQARKFRPKGLDDREARPTLRRIYFTIKDKAMQYLRHADNPADCYVLSDSQWDSWRRHNILFWGMLHSPSTPLRAIVP